MVNEAVMETALKRHEMIAPLLMPGIEEAEKRRIRREIIDRENISERTLRRYIAAYRENSYDGLKPKVRDDIGSLKAIPQKVLDHAAELKQELPERSVRRIIRILEGEGIVPKGDISRSTLSRHLLNMGFGSADMKITKVMASDPRRVSEVHVEFDMPKVNYSEKEKAILDNAARTCPVALSLHPDVKQVIRFNYK